MLVKGAIIGLIIALQLRYISYDPAIAKEELKSHFELTKGTTYPTLPSELYDV